MMARFDRSSHRLHVEAPLAADALVLLGPASANYLCNVLRLGVGDGVLVFNGRDGEWRAELTEVARKSVHLRAVRLERPQPPPRDLRYLFAPLKHARLDYVVQKAVEMGASRLQPVVTQHTQAARVNSERMAANVIEAAQQCGVIAIPEVRPPLPLGTALADCRDGWLVFCDEEAPIADPLAALGAARAAAAGIAVLIGPEGGFDATERAAILALPHVVRLSLGPRILRADTAAVAALALVQATLGDWIDAR
jgi:16S rRNA (uracil1498-N3)-methyltransferase